MKSLLFGALTFCFVVQASLLLAQASSHASAAKKLTPPQLTDSFSYAVGILEYANFKRNKIDINHNSFKQAFDDAHKKQPKLSDSLAAVVFQNKMRLMAQEALVNQKKQNAVFFAAIKKRPEIKELQPGIYYEILKDSVGSPKPMSDTTQVKVHYVGNLLDGTEFDNSYKTGNPVVFPLNGVIKGWTEVLRKMSVGSRWRVYLDSDYAYGDRGAGNIIPPGAGLTFDIYLLEIVKK